MSQWMASPKANYYPFLKTIYILKEDRYKFKFRNTKDDKNKLKILTHELTHWFIHLFLNNNIKYHNYIDKRDLNSLH